MLGVISDGHLSLAVGRFLRRLKYRFGTLRSIFEYLLVNEWSEGQRHFHILVRVTVDLTRQMIRILWKKTLPDVPFTCHCEAVRNPEAIARYVVKDLRDASKKELAPQTFSGRLYTYSRGFFTKPVAALWKDQLREWYLGQRANA